MIKKKPLKIGVVDSCLEPFYREVLSERYDLTFDKENPDFLFFGDENFGTENLKYSRDKCIKIFHTGENRRPENYDCHYALSFDHNNSSWHYRLTGWSMTPFFYNKHPFFHIANAHNVRHEKTKFCVFIHRNPNCQVRNAVFSEVSKYKKVDSAGTLFNNTGFIVGPEYDEKLDFIKNYKFVFAFENSSYPGYLTEKIMDAFYVNSVPLYWGSPTVDLDFNENSFINAGKFRTIQDLVNYIIEVDNNDELYEKIISQPKFKHGVIPSALFYDNFLNWFDATVYNKINMRQ
jgi:hypothetical protein